LKSFFGSADDALVQELTSAAKQLRRKLGKRVIWNVNSTAAGGGVAEMLHGLVGYARALGIDTRWLVIDGTPDFFRLTKRLHHALHGERGDGSALDDAARPVYESAMAGNLPDLVEKVQPGDVVILHDPQTAGLVQGLVARGARVIWRCHIGFDGTSVESEAGWSFLSRYLQQADTFVFSRFSYVPDCCDPSRTVVIQPTIDPCSPKNIDLDPAVVNEILARIGFVEAGPMTPSATVAFEGERSVPVTRKASLVTDGFLPTRETPLIVQVSRWDPLKDPVGVLEGFQYAVENLGLQDAHLALVGPDVSSVSDDPEGLDVLKATETRWRSLPPAIRRRVHLVSLPMDDLEENALMVNAIQQHATLIVQKSLREGFGLTVTEAMWKARPVIASAVGGIQDQITHGIDGWLLGDPRDVEGFAAALAALVRDPDLCRRLGARARARVAQRSLGLWSLLRFGGLVESMGLDDEILDLERAV